MEVESELLGYLSMIYVDSSHLHGFLKDGKPLSGIQRLTLNCLVGLWQVRGSDQVKAMVFSAKEKKFMTCRVEDFLRDGGQSDLQFLPTNFNSADSVLLTEYFWNRAVSAAAAKHATFNDAKVFRFIHDVIPLALPRLYARSWVRSFRKFIGDAIAGADVILTNSDFSKRDIEKHYPNIPRLNEIAVLKLPHEFLAVEDVLAHFENSDAVRSDRINIPRDAEMLRGKSFVLTVGSLEARKNPEAAIWAWRELFKRHGDKLPMLVLAGNFTSHSPIYRFRLRIGIAANPKILHLRGCDDLTLQWLYQNCAFSLFLSKYEGWGLPVGESLWFGKPVVASNATSLPEVGPGLVDYVDPNNKSSVLAAIERQCFDVDWNAVQSVRLKNAKHRTWEAFVRELLGIMVCEDTKGL